MKNYSPAEKEFVLRPIIWLVFHIIILLFWAVFSFATAYALKYMIISHPILRWSAAIVLATGMTVLILRVLNIYLADSSPKNQTNQVFQPKNIKLSEQIAEK